jgi:SAM-dependent methyltransferase
MNLHDWHEAAAYDAVFTRFVLHHMREPVAVLRSMWEGVGPGGVLMVEDADFDGWACHPSNPGFEFFKRTYAEIVHRWGGDHAIGRKLPAYFREAGISRPEIKLVHPIYLEGETKMLPWTTLEATAEPIVAEAIASREEVAAALDDLASFSQGPESVIVGPAIFQLWSRRST